LADLQRGAAISVSTTVSMRGPGPRYSLDTGPEARVNGDARGTYYTLR